ncbi:hypothetical protein [Notoacmeibacter sp. MSK16QG-6]|uniref:hypothetical protein n=1 Tax=Notoacmeibacter sp. MSK16QG-6 TaxID=2957982 RepID=UPI00209DCAAC|nr:hypothetical protein [Notoacmeibacter sp. MSK16QG-6]MCP1200060.1 hypothetical protein [Notoacmeibacter sp. MSK16QG-6]
MAKTTKKTTTTPASPKPATEFTPAGAPVQTVTDVDASHPAVDNDPRADTSAEQNAIDFNDPNKSGEDAVAENLGMKTRKEATQDDR